MEKTIATIKTGVAMQTKRYVLTNLGIQGNFRVSYPFATLTFYETYLSIEIHLPSILSSGISTKYELKYDNIDYIQKGFLYIRIFHRQSNISKYLYISGIAGASSIFKEITSYVKDNNLSIKIK